MQYQKLRSNYKIPWRFSFKLFVLGCIPFLFLLSACERPDPIVEEYLEIKNDPNRPLAEVGSTPQQESVSSPLSLVVPTPTLKTVYEGTPTPDPTAETIDDGTAEFHLHTVIIGETAVYIAELYEISVEELLNLNDLEDADNLSEGLELVVPGEEIPESPNYKIVPDSELVYGPEAETFDVVSFVDERGGYLSTYSEEVEGRELTGGEIVQLIAERFSVNPRLLLSVLEHQSQWLTLAAPEDNGYPMGFINDDYEGLYQQLSWAANKMNLGFYGRSEGGLRYFDVAEQDRYRFAAGINDGTAGLQLLFASYPETSAEKWMQEIGPEGIHETYSKLFGNPFNFTVDPLWPSDVEQPSFLLPFESGDVWYFTGGPHGGWASGSAWAALDFSPGDGRPGCEISNYWVTAIADGVIARSSFGAVVLDLDGDGNAGTGWAVTYMHISSLNRIAPGTRIHAGERIGHPSCEGGFSNATHLHIARTLNGRWVSADGDIPFQMGEWSSEGLGREYDGLMVSENDIKEACQCEAEFNAIIGD